MEQERLRLRAREGGSCSLCREELATGEALHACPGCSTSYHAVCAAEFGGCAVLGCEAREAPRVATDALTAQRRKRIRAAAARLRGPLVRRALRGRPVTAYRILIACLVAGMFGFVVGQLVGGGSLAVGRPPVTGAWIGLAVGALIGIPLPRLLE